MPCLEDCTALFCICTVSLGGIVSKVSKKVIRKNMRLRQDLIDRAKRILGTKTETETVEQALEMVAFREEVVEGIERIAGSDAIRDIYEEAGR